MFGAPLLPRTLEAALRDLGSDKPSMRVEAARDLGRLDDALVHERVVGGLKRALGGRKA